MAKFRKAILRTGTYHSPDGVVDVTPERLHHWASEFARMKSASQVVPIDWDHATDAAEMTPLSLQDFEKRHSAAKGVGRLEDFRLSPDGESAEIVLDVRTPRAVEAAEANTCFVSPVLFPSWRDGAGNEYRDCITHVDFVHHPVDHSQGAFVPVEQGAIACALRMSLSTNIYRFGKDNPMPNEFPPSKEDEASKEDSAEDQAEGEVENETDGTVQGADNSTLANVIDTLAKFNIMLAEGTTGQNLLERLHSALLTAVAHQGLDEKKDEVAEPEAGQKPQPKPEVIQDPGIAVMSLQTKAVIAHAERQHRATIAERLSSLCNSGRCTPAELKAQQERLPAVKLSLNAQGEPEVSDVETFIAHREAVPKGTFWTDEQRTRLSSVVEPPVNMALEPGAEDLNNLTDWALGRKAKPQ